MKSLSKQEKRYRGLHYEVGQLPAAMIDSYAFWSLPYKVRRLVYKAIVPGSKRHLIKIRSSIPANTSSPTLKPFLDTKSIFVHIPKAAGISISFSLYGRKTGDHRTIGDYKLSLSKKEFDQAFKFTFVRNPWDRVLSAYSYLKQGGRNKNDQKYAHENLSRFKSFEEFVINWLNRANVESELHFKPQYRFLTTCSSKPEIDYIGRFEKLNRDYQQIRQNLGIGDELKNYNNFQKESDSDYRKYYNDRTKEIVRKVYWEDIEMLEYSFDKNYCSKS